VAKTARPKCRQKTAKAGSQPFPPVAIQTGGMDNGKDHNRVVPNDEKDA
jgi:hypothetical protein